MVHFHNFKDVPFKTSAVSFLMFLVRGVQCRAISNFEWPTCDIIAFTLTRFHLHKTRNHTLTYEIFSLPKPFDILSV